MFRLKAHSRAAIILACLAPLPAVAQIIVDPSLRDPSKTRRQGPNTQFSPLAVAPWPRLDPGAIICRTRDDLEEQARALEERASGQPVSLLGSPDCRVVTTVTGIEVVTRLTPSETEVRVKGDPKTSWTNTWLPAQKPR
jgi:hypothetical protein